jgi:transposase
VDDHAAVGGAGLAGVRPHRYAQGHGFSGALFAFRGKRGGLIKILWFDGQGMCRFSKRLEKGHFLWPTTNTGRVSLTAAQVSMLLEGIDWRMPPRVRRPELAG